MGTNHSHPTAHPHSIPNRPFDKHGTAPRSCIIDAAYSLPKSFLPFRRPPTSLTVLAQLVLLQDWQRVLIRITLFPKEITQPCVVYLYGQRWKVLPIHLACALQPPTMVIQMLLTNGTISTPVVGIPYKRYRGRRRRRRHCNKGWKPNWSAKRLGRRRRRRRRRQQQQHVEIDLDFASKHKAWKCPSILPSVCGSQDPASVCFSNQEGSWEEVEQQEDNLDQVSTTSSSSNSSSSSSSRATRRGDNILVQLTDMGQVERLVLHPPPPPPLIESKETTSTADDEPFLDETSWWAMQEEQPPPILSLDTLQESLMVAVSESACLLPVHIACLYQASPDIVQVLLQVYPMGAQSEVMGMLPIHWVASGCVADPLEPPLELVAALLGRNDTRLDAQESLACQVMELLLETVPESLDAKSTRHGWTPVEYLERGSMDERTRQECFDLVDCRGLSNGIPALSSM